VSAPPTAPAAQAPPAKSLRRDTGRAMIGGVCAGIAQFLDIDIALTRVAYVLLTVFTAFAGVLVYIILWILVPAERPAPPDTTTLPQQR